MGSRQRRFAVCALALAVRTASADCNAPMADALIEYSLVKLNAIIRCERRRPNAQCLPSDGQVTDRRTSNRLRAASRRLHGALDDACSVLPHRVGAPCGDAQSLDDVAACVMHSPVDDVHAVTVEDLAAVLDVRGVPRGDRHLRVCRDRITAGARDYVIARASALGACRDAEIRRTPCPDAAALKAADGARATMEASIHERCTDADAGRLQLGGVCGSFLLTTFERIAVPANPNGNVVPPLDALIHCVGWASATAVDRVLHVAQPGPPLGDFTAGVAAGDATDSSVILWTRLPDPSAPALVEIAPDLGFVTEVVSRQVSATPGEDGTVRVEMPLGRPHATYYYRFIQGPLTSPTGQVTRPSSTGRRLRDAADVFLWAAGTNAFLRPFSVLDPLRVGELDAFIYAGDTIAADDARGDGVVASTFDEFAGKYRANRVDSALRALLRSTVTFAIPDDGEVRRGYAGAEPGFGAVGATGLRAFKSYFPIRDDPVSPTRLYRRVQWGSLVELFLLDGRQYRTAELVCCADGTVEAIAAEGQGTCGAAGSMLQPDDACRAALSAPGRTVLGAEQKAWLEDALTHSSAKLKLVIGGPAMTEGALLPYDRWEDYPAERGELLDFVRDKRVNAIWLGSGAGAVFVSTPGVDATHRIPAATVGAVAAPTFLETLPTSAMPLVPSVPALFPLVTRFEIDRPTAARISIEDVGFISVHIDYFDEAGQKISSVTIRA